ncbi:hypothetical protein ADL15_04815 [Actinoplanes awajinensis subsp. mycoplanecinus]|uniref:Uncharacterized protein n=1 Tax=Actinoplanes awajinensis subsp. mycoplanecinus TaxID=135947 RepID=A0A0X3VA02_9ACTN|nr:hypothetical protein ADL15_04815 [Actinoplanes awajinensis subsp. mycoplanecinus]
MGDELVSNYAVDDDGNVLIRTWAAGHGHLAAVVAAIPESAPRLHRLDLAAQLSGLADTLWRCYTHPASAAASTEPHTEGWRRQQSRDSFGAVADAIRAPHLVDGDGYLVVEYDPVQEYANRVGRALHTIGDEALSQAVVADVDAERDAVERAELGDLTGRAVQAVTLSRTDASPAQVAAADAVLDKDPLGGSELFRELEPTAAAVAAAHWLKAAADVTADLTGIPAEQVVVAADDLESLPYRTPTVVLELFAAGGSPHQLVVDLVGDAMLIAEGLAPGTVIFAGGEGRYEEADEPDLDDDDDDDDDVEPGVLAGEPVRMTPLDPSRPARDLLEDLLIGIHGCQLLYTDFKEDEGAGAGANEAFREAVRTRAAKDRSRLL